MCKDNKGCYHYGPGVADPDLKPPSPELCTHPGVVPDIDTREYECKGREYLCKGYLVGEKEREEPFLVLSDDYSYAEHKDQEPSHHAFCYKPYISVFNGITHYNSVD